MARESETDYRSEYAYWGSAPITPSDTVPAAGSLIYRNIYATGAGAVKVRMLDGSTPIFTLAANSFLPFDILFDMVFATGTAATGITALY